MYINALEKKALSDFIKYSQGRNCKRCTSSSVVIISSFTCTCISFVATVCKCFVYSDFCCCFPGVSRLVLTFTVPVCWGTP